jgi:hypothetical protein
MKKDMKKIYLLFTSVCAFTFVVAQTENYDLESWTANTGYDDADNWLTANQYAGFLGIAPPVEKISTGAPQGFFAAKMTTRQCASCLGLLGAGTDPLTGLMQQNVPFIDQPATVTFMYDYTGVNGDVGLAYFEYTMWDVAGDSAIIIAAAADTLGNTTGWSSRTLSFIPANAGTPDSLKVTLVSSAYFVIGDPGLVTPQVGSALSIDAISFDTQVGIDEIEEIDFSATISFGQLKVTTNQLVDASVQVVDLTGRTVLHSNVTSDITFLNISSFPKGIYLVRINNGVNATTKKIIIE